MDVTVIDAADARRLEARIGDELAGFLTYERRNGHIVAKHTEVLPTFEGRGIGGYLARAIVDDARARGVKLRSVCPFVTSWLSRHPEHDEIRYP